MIGALIFIAATTGLVFAVPAIRRRTKDEKQGCCG